MIDYPVSQDILAKVNIRTCKQGQVFTPSVPFSFWGATATNYIKAERAFQERTPCKHFKKKEKELMLNLVKTINGYESQ